jgi:hypothetical protein
MRRQRLIFLPLIFILVSFIPNPARAQQPWSGIISPSRATDWTGAGVVGGIPSATWTQCGPTIPAGASTPTIQAAINACGTNQFVLLAPGTYSLTVGIRMKANMVLRGSGANQTFLVAAAGAIDSCSGGYPTAICFIGPAAGYWVQDAAVNWTAGFAQGSTQITLSSTAGITPNSTVIGLDQCGEGMSGSPCAGNEVDNGQFFNCSLVYTSGNPSTGCAVNGPDGGNQRLYRSQNELFQVSAVNASTGVVTLKGSLRNPNWNPARTPQVFVIQPIQNAGVENLSIDTSGDTASKAPVVFYYAANVWAKGLRVVEPNYAGIFFVVATHATAEQNYIYGANHGIGSDIFGMNSTASSDLLFQNNIVQREQVCMGVEGADTGSVYAYNLCINQYDANDGIYPAAFPHAGDHYQLYEGNVQNSYYGENFHGPKLMNTHFRNFITGWESCANGNCGGATSKNSATVPYRTVAYSRYHNAIANVLGTPGYHSSAYQDGSLTSIYSLGSGNSSSSGSTIPNDPLVAATFLRWANYDTATGAVRFCGNSSNTGWSAACAGTSEIPTGAPSYPNTVPTVGDTEAGQGALPASFYLSAKPVWFGSLPFPSIGPDVTNGNIGQCAGTLNVPEKFNGLPATSSSQCAGSGLTSSAWAGHVNATPALNCYLNVMGGAPDGSGSVLAFDASSCYPGGVVTSGGPNPPTNLTLTVSPD